MGILDDAIREHLDLKRKHGARDSEISEIEDEALGSGDRPDPFAAGELFGGVSSSASAPSPAQGAPAQELDEPTPPPDGPSTPPPGGLEEPPPEEEPTALVEQPSAPPEPPRAEPPRAEPPEPSFPEPPPAEPEGRSAPEPPAESESLEKLMAEDEESGPPRGADPAIPPPPPPESEAAARPGGEPARPIEPDQPLPGPLQEPLEEPLPEPEPEASEFEAGPEPPPPPPPAATEGQRGRARGRADVPTQEHISARQETGDVPSMPSEPEPPPDEGAPRLYDFETDSGLLEDEGADLGAPPPPPAEDSDDFEALGPVDEGEEVGDDLYPVEEEPHGEQRGGTTDFEEADVVEEDLGTEVRPPAPPEEDEEGYRTEVRPADPDEEEDDLLSESPEFLDKDTDDSLWFEKGPPKDFEFEDDED